MAGMLGNTYNAGLPTGRSTYGGSGMGGPAPTPPRGNTRYDPNVGYAGGTYNDPNTWASDEDYNQYKAHQAGQAMTGLQQAAGPTASSVDRQGVTTPYTPYPNMMTNQYQTDAGQGGGTTHNTPTQGTLTPMAYENQQQTQLEAQLAQQGVGQKASLSSAAFQERLKALSPFLGGAAGGQGGTAGQVGGPPNPDSDAARNAIFARAKDKSGQISRSAVDALTNLMSERGMKGSGQEAAGYGGIAAGAENQLGEVNREQMVQDLDRLSHVQDLTYQGNITQRGQDLQKQQALIALLNAGNLF